MSGYPYDGYDGSDESFERLMASPDQATRRRVRALDWAQPRVALLIGPGYDDEQVAWIARTALANPGVPVVFGGHDGKEQITRTDGGWEITGAA